MPQKEDQEFGAGDIMIDAADAGMAQFETSENEEELVPSSSDLLGKNTRSWAKLKAFDDMEEEEIRNFEKIRDHTSISQRFWEEFKRNPIMFIGIGGACYCLCAGMTAMGQGREWAVLKYLEGRIYMQ